MKLKEFINKKHDTDRIAESATEVRRHITGCVTEGQRETARNYVNSWRELMLYQEKLDQYKGFKKFACRLLGVDEHQKCICYINSVHDILMSTINNDIQ